MSGLNSVPATILVTVEWQGQQQDLKIQLNIKISDLVNQLIKLLSPQLTDSSQDWDLSFVGGVAFDPSSKVIECGITQGSKLSLTRRYAVSTNNKVDLGYHDPIAHSLDFSNDFSPLERTRSILPSKMSNKARFALSVKAFFSSQSTKDLVSLEPLVDRVTPSSLTIPRKSTPLERAKKTWRQSDYLHLLRQGIAKPQLSKCATIAVVSPKGGVGKTSITSLLGMLLAMERRDRIVAIDANPDFGSLGRSLAPDHKIFVDDLLDMLSTQTLSTTTLDANLGRTTHGLMVLPAPTDPERMAKLDEVSYTHVVDRLKNMVGVIVLDCGTGLQDPTSKAALSRADQVILVSDSEPASASLVADAARILNNQGIPLWLVVNKRPEKGTLLDLNALARSVPFARGMMTIPLDSQAATQLSAGNFNWAEAPGRWQIVIRELALMLMTEWPSLGLALDR